FQLCLRDALVLADGRDAPVYFLRVVLSVVVPAFQPLSRLLAEQAARSCHGDGLDQVLAALSHSAGTGGQRDGFPLVVFAIEPRTRRGRRNVECLEGRGGPTVGPDRRGRGGSRRLELRAGLL